MDLAKQKYIQCYILKATILKLILDYCDFSSQDCSRLRNLIIGAYSFCVLPLSYALLFRI